MKHPNEMSDEEIFEYFAKMYGYSVEEMADPEKWPERPRTKFFEILGKVVRRHDYISDYHMKDTTQADPEGVATIEVMDSLDIDESSLYYMIDQRFGRLAMNDVMRRGAAGGLGVAKRLFGAAWVDGFSAGVALERRRLVNEQKFDQATANDYVVIESYGGIPDAESFRSLVDAQDSFLALAREHQEEGYIIATDIEGTKWDGTLQHARADNPMYFLTDNDDWELRLS